MSTQEPTHLVTVHQHVGGARVIFRGAEAKCRAIARDFNSRYQSNSYRVEEIDPNHEQRSAK